MYLYQVQENEVEVVIAMFEQNTTFYNNEYFPGGSVPKSGKTLKMLCIYILNIPFLCSY